MKMDTQQLIIELLNKEISKADHIATLGYRDDIRTAKRDFIEHAKTLGASRQRRR